VQNNETELNPVADLLDSDVQVEVVASEVEKADKPKIEHRILIVHDKDQDGYCAAHIVKQYKKQPTVAVGMVAWGHSKDLRTLVIDPDKWDEIFIVDLVTPLTYVKDLLLNGFKVTIIDHHETTLTNLAGVEEEGLEAILDSSTSACGGTWKHFYNDTPMPWVVQMVNNWDIWKHEDPQVIPFHYGMECINLEDHKIWAAMLKGDPQSCAQIMQMGQLVGSYWINEQNEITSSHSFTVVKDGLKFMVCNGWFTSSYDFAGTFQKGEHDAMMWFRFAPGQGEYPWRISFRTTKEDIDLLKYAEAYRGGGHKQACGCNMTQEELIMWITTQSGPRHPVEETDVKNTVENN